MEHARRARLRSPNLFVYGTLRHGSGNAMARLLQVSASLLGSGQARGRLYRVADYPGFVPAEAGEDWVRGDVYRLRSPRRTYRALDRYEGCGAEDPEPHEYRRIEIPVRLDCGTWITAGVYGYARDTGGLVRIASGEFGARDRR